MIEYMDAYLIFLAFMKVPRPKSSDGVIVSFRVLEIVGSTAVIKTMKARLDSQ